VLSDAGFAFALGVGRAHHLFGLLGQRLRKPSGQPEPIPTPMHCLQVRQRRREVLSLPEQINKILKCIVAAVKELFQGLSFAHVQVIQVDPRRAPHHRLWSMAVGLDHKRHIVPMIGKEIKN